jgi:hypothetical protein
MGSYLEVFSMPKPVSITARTSSITNSFVNGIIPCVQPTEAQVEEALKILELDKDDLRCAYCGDKATEWDHLRPLVVDKKPTGYISDIYNLVPACGKCNQSKGNRNWREWMLSSARLSPKSRKVPDLDLRIKRLEKYEEWGNVTPLDFSTLVDEELWRRHWENCAELHKRMQEAQRIASRVREQIQCRLKNPQELGNRV